jgi:hypothetical protein
MGFILKLSRKRCNFCNTSGAELKETLSFSDYIDVVTSKNDEPGAAKDQPISVLNKTKNGKENIKIYLRSRKRVTEMDEDTKEFLKQKMDFELKVRPALSIGTLKSRAHIFIESRTLA